MQGGFHGKAIYQPDRILSQFEDNGCLTKWLKRLSQIQGQ